MFVALAAVALSFKLLREPDLWWQLRTGNWILENLSITTTDIFSFTYSGVEWINVKWLFEVLQALFFKLGGAEMLYLMQSVVNLGILWVFWKLSKQNARTDGQILAFVFSILLIFLSLNFRMNGRPEMISHLLTALFLFLYFRHRHKSDRWIFLLIPLQALWTNLHEAFGVGMVLLSVFIFSAIVEGYVLKTREKPDLKIILASLLSFPAMSLNPRGFYMLMHPFEIFGQVGQNKFTTELYSFRTDYYWLQLEPYIAIALIVFVVFGVLLIRNGERQFLKRISRDYGIAYVIIFVAFVYLSSTAHRNLPFLLIWSFPAVFKFINFLTDKWKKKLAQLTISALLSFFFWLSITQNWIYRSTDSDFRYGLGISAIDNPIGASNYIKSNDLKGNCFSDYLVSSYLLWDLRPDFRSFIDFRDLDIFPAEFFQAFNQMAAYPADFEKYHSEYDFGYAVLNRIQFPALHQYLLTKEGWELAFVDPVAAVFVNTAMNPVKISDKAVFERENIFEELATAPTSGLASFLSTIVSPIPSQSDFELNLDLEACNYFQSLGRYDLAIKRAESVLSKDPQNSKILLAAGNAYLNWSNIQDKPELRNKLLRMAYESFNSAFQLDRENFEYLLGIAQVQMNLGKAFDAMGSLRSALKIQENSRTYALMAQCQNLLMQADPKNTNLYTNKWYEFMHKAHDLEPSDPILNYNLGVSYCQSADCEKARSYLENASFTPDLSQAEMQTLAECKQRCGVKD